MKKKLIFVLTFAIATIALFVGAGCSGASSDARAIDKVISQANKIETEDIDSNSSKKEMLDAIAHCTARLRAIDTSDCPKDFRIAYEHFVSSLDNYYNVIRTMPEGFWGNLFSGSDYRESINAGLKRIQNAVDEINLVAARYGAKERISTSEE